MIIGLTNHNINKKMKPKYVYIIFKRMNMSNLHKTPNNVILENRELIQENFKKCVKGYHLLNTSPINETIWEDLNALIFSSSGIDVYSKSDGSHQSGMDIHSSVGNISNKSAKYSHNKNNISISSYRLTKICSEKNCGTYEEIIQEINNRKNFDFYSLIVRDETSDPNNINYDWFFIPSNYAPLDPSGYQWQPTLGKRGKKIDTQIGWHTNEINGYKMSVTFSMSSQLWIHIVLNEEIKNFIIASSSTNKIPLYNYIEIADKL
jgi:hypothetical protein